MEPWARLPVIFAEYWRAIFDDGKAVARGDEFFDEDGAQADDQIGADATIAVEPERRELLDGVAAIHEAIGTE